MTNNEQSAENLKWSIGVLNEMKQAAQDHLRSLEKLAANDVRASGTGTAAPWLTDSIARQRDAIEHISKSITAAEGYLGLALAEWSRCWQTYLMWDVAVRCLTSTRRIPSRRGRPGVLYQNLRPRAQSGLKEKL